MRSWQCRRSIVTFLDAERDGWRSSVSRLSHSGSGSLGSHCRPGEGIFRLLGGYVRKTLEVDPKTYSKEVLCHGRVKVLMGTVLKLLMKIPLLVRDLQILVVAALDADPGDDFQPVWQSQSCDAVKSKVSSDNHGLEEGGNEDCTRHDDISPAFSNFEMPPFKPYTRLLDQRGIVREKDSNSTSDCGSAAPSSPLGFGSTDHGDSPYLAQSHRVGSVLVGPPLDSMDPPFQSAQARKASIKSESMDLFVSFVQQ